MNPEKTSTYRKYLALMVRKLDEAASIGPGPKSQDEASELYQMAEACRWALGVLGQQEIVATGTTHSLKIWPGYFEEILHGRKTFEIRKDDRGFRVGDTLLLREWDPQTEEHTGRQASKQVTYLTRGPSWGLPGNVVVMSIR